MRVRRDPTVVFLLVVGAALLVVTGVAVAFGGGDDDEASTTTTTERPDPAITCPGADGRSRELRRCLADAIAFIETEYATGSGVLLPNGQIVTNAHVVDPFTSVDVTFPGGERHEDVPVIGVDALADVAVLRPIDTERRGIHVRDLPDLDEDDEPDVFLVGYPGGVEGDDPQVTLASGIVSRVREVERFGTTYLQSDAAIAGGQSGGALVDANGRYLGMSGLGFAQEFALALSADDVLEAVDRVLSTGGDDRRIIPVGDDATSDPVTADLPVKGATLQVVVPSTATDRTLRVAVTGDRPVALDARGLLGEALGANQASIDIGRRLAEEFGFPPEDVPVLPEVTPGMYEVELPADWTGLLSVSFADEQPGAVTVDVDVPFVAHASYEAPSRLRLGETERVVVDAFTYEHLFELELVEGEEVEIAVHGTTIDPYFVVFGPGEVYDAAAEPAGDDGGGGLYDADAVDVLRAAKTGVYTIAVGTYDGVLATYEVSVTPLG